MKKHVLILFLTVLVSNLSMNAQKKFFTKAEDTKNYTVVELAQLDQQFSIFAKLLKMSGLDASALYADGYTVLMPTNEAFGEMEAKKLAALSNPDNRIELMKVIKNHILPHKVWLSDFKENNVLDTSGDEKLTISTTSDDMVTIGGTKIIKADVKASDGVIHVVNSVIDL